MNNRADQLQFFRFCAFLLICAHHMGGCQLSWFPHGNGAANAVEFFIVLSGAVIGISSYKREIKCSFSNIFVYIKKKIKLFYPLYFITTIFTIIFSPILNNLIAHNFVGSKRELWQLVKNLFLIQSWFPTSYFSFNGVGWFLSTIMFLYFINIPLRAIATKICKLKYAEVIYIGIILSFYLLTWLYCYFTRNTNMEYTQYVLPVSRIGEYICGMSLGYLICLINQKVTKNEIMTILFTIFEILTVMVWIGNMYMPIKSWHYRIVHWIIINLFLIFVFGIGRGKISDFFKLNFLRYLGDISFECFLLHQIIITLYMRYVNLGTGDNLGKLISLLFCIFMTVMIANLITKSKYRKRVRV